TTLHSPLPIPNLSQDNGALAKPQDRHQLLSAMHFKKETRSKTSHHHQHQHQQQQQHFQTTMPDDGPVPLLPHEITPLLTSIQSLSTQLPSFKPGPTTPPRYFQTSIQKNLEWSQHTLQRLSASFRKYDKDVYNQSQIAYNMSVLRNVISKLTEYHRRIEQMRLEQGEHVSLDDVYRRGEGRKKNEPYGVAGQLLDGPQRYGYYNPPK
ncbi:hypothetical protein F5Y02DRAFT_427446, partial [Annulohypoxylon stygium]